MEEDNRSYYHSRPFRQYQYRCISEASPTIHSASASASVDNHRHYEASPSLRTRRFEEQRSDGTTTAAAATTTTAITTGNQFGVFGTPKTTALSVASSGVLFGGKSKSKRCCDSILGMTPLEDDNKRHLCSRYLVVGGGMDETSNDNDNDNKIGCRGGGHCGVHQAAAFVGSVELPHQQKLVNSSNSSNKTSWLDETQRLLRDYQHRFHRQSLTEQAKELLDRASVLARTESNNNNTNRAVIAICTQALALCNAAIEDQLEATMNNRNNENSIGGSYLVTGDIHLRRRGEALAAKIHCLRAAVCYQEGRYEESLEDCEASISLWSRGFYYGREQKSQHRAAATTTSRTGHNHCVGSGSNTTKATESTVANNNNNNNINNNNNNINNNNHGREKGGKRVARNKTKLKLLSRKRLYLLKSRVLASMGRYRDAVKWLTHPQNLPSKTFRRSSALLETDATMNTFLEQLRIRSNSNVSSNSNSNSNKNKQSIKRRKTTTITMAQDDAAGSSRPDDHTTPSTTTTTSPCAERVIVPTNLKLWSNLLHSVDKRLNEGVPGTVTVVNKSSGERNRKPISNLSCGNQRSNSGNAIYLMLRHGSVLFHHSK